jgi:BirA family biotin operon repressor/biotin-[acetyl-CoA-carboxylase] ligase
MVRNKKLGGILTELKTGHGRILFAILGIGINVNIESNAFPDDIKQIATSIKAETGKPYSRELISAEILNEIDHWYRVLQKKGREMLLSEWQKLSSTLGKKVRVTVDKETFTGLAEAMDDEGMLLLRLPSGVIKRINSGDLIELR